MVLALFGSLGLLEVIFLAAAALVLVVPAWKLCSRLGFPGWFGVLILVPLVNLALLYFLAFAPWPGENPR